MHVDVTPSKFVACQAFDWHARSACTYWRSEIYDETSALHLQAANYLNIKSLLDLTCLTVANMIKGALLGNCDAVYRKVKATPALCHSCFS